MLVVWSCYLEKNFLTSSTRTILSYCDNTQAIQIVFNHLAINIPKYGTYFAPSKCKLLLRDCQECVPALIHFGGQLEVVEKFMYLGSCVNADGGVSDVINLRIM